MSQVDLDDQQLHLRWNNHTNNIVDIFREQFSKQSLVDVTLSCQGKRFKAHRLVLSACSPYFQVNIISVNMQHCALPFFKREAVQLFYKNGSINQIV
jgi:hypothetical protein